MKITDHLIAALGLFVTLTVFSGAFLFDSSFD